MFVVDLVKNLPHELATFLLALIPITELRASIPVAIGLFKMSALSAFFWSVLGSIFITIILVYMLDFVTKFLRPRFKWADKFFDWLFERTRKRFEGKYLTYGEIALIIFVAIPLPVTGVWTGSLAAYLFGIERKKSVLLISIGAMIAGFIVTIISAGGVALFA
ncbi:ligand-binding protein SH3 [Candidatus Falkowbacteria bacterium CG10_big_fil_rev_8_21_14_0_10_39_11]|uniref:Ligand-binding protein SH3 n=1 Tax=Candidatus Falkowbacteria bacterium CG10_big_fil_rev_8_21_14_0_10_39_11 TaxID=1974565 RepID=A0A2H0V7A7_9BACT|nr:MAG: ligand-binding protein SH3 [Candidatus Falkowbacteria bacterium CG10_big_fil_rev_8_21_14_0_10_39_11]